jgi:pyridoxal phosphate enzyme (YggS family)
MMLTERLERVRARMKAAGGENVALLAVSKGQPVEAAAAALQAGLTSLGENYAQELAAKAETLADSDPAPVWHFIGQLQTNKVRMIAPQVAVWQSVDRIKVGREIAKRAPGATVFAQVNLSSEPQKAGCSFDDLDELVDQLRDLALVVTGLMGVGSAEDDVSTAAGFRKLRSAADRLRLPECSMGMSADLEIAIREGSTMVRVGSDLFGPRQ